MEMISKSLSHMARLKELTLDMQSMELNNKSANKFFSRLKSLHTLEVLTIILKKNKIDPIVQLVVDMNKAFGTSEKQ